MVAGDVSAKTSPRYHQSSRPYLPAVVASVVYDYFGNRINKFDLDLDVFSQVFEAELGRPKQKSGLGKTDGQRVYECKERGREREEYKLSIYLHVITDSVALEDFVAAHDECFVFLCGKGLLLFLLGSGLLRLLLGKEKDCFLVRAAVIEEFHQVLECFNLITCVN